MGNMETDIELVTVKKKKWKIVKVIFEQTPSQCYLPETFGHLHFL